MPRPTPEEQEFTTRLDELEQDARAAARFTYAAEAIDHLRHGRPALMAALDRDAGFWGTVLGALQTAAVAALARIYGPEPDAMSADRLLQHASAHRIGLFSRLALESRRARTRPIETAIAASAGAYQPCSGDFASLRAALDARIASFRRNVAPIRAEIFPESRRAALLETLSLYQVVPRAEFEGLALFPSSLHGALARLYHEGRKPELEETPSDVAALLARPREEWDEAIPEQSLAAREAWRFLTALAADVEPERGRGRRPPYED